MPLPAEIPAWLAAVADGLLQGLQCPDLRGSHQPGHQMGTDSSCAVLRAAQCLGRGERALALLVLVPKVCRACVRGWRGGRGAEQDSTPPRRAPRCHQLSVPCHPKGWAQDPDPLLPYSAFTDACEISVFFIIHTCFVFVTGDASLC